MPFGHRRPARGVPFVRVPKRADEGVPTRSAFARPLDEASSCRPFGRSALLNVGTIESSCTPRQRDCFGRLSLWYSLRPGDEPSDAGEGKGNGRRWRSGPSRRPVPTAEPFALALIRPRIVERHAPTCLKEKEGRLSPPLALPA